MGGSGLIVVVIVAAWALFLVPQWMHRRASAAAHLADRIEPAEGDQTRGSGRSGRRHLRRTRVGATPSARRFSRWHLPSMPRVRIPARRERAATIVTSPASATVSPAARRRRILTVLALATLLTAAVVGVAALANLPVPTWLVAVPGGLMAGYLALLAIVRPGAPRRGTTDSLPALPVSDTDTDTDTDAGTGTDTHADMVGAEVAAAVDEPTVTVAEPPVTVEPQVEDDTWTPVPLPSPTYVTAPRARRSVRSIDLSNPGSWTSSAAPAPAAATLAPSESDENQEHLVEHRRAVGG